MLARKIHHSLYLFSTALLCIGLPVSYFLLSLGIILLAMNWLAEGDFSHKLQLLRKRKSIGIFLTLYLVHVTGLLYTSNFNYAWHDLRIKLPLIALPLIYGTSPALTRNEFKVIVNLLLATVLVATLISTYILLGFSNIELVDPRNASPFISHIRFSLILVVCLGILFYWLAIDQEMSSPLEKKLYPILALWFICYLFFLKAFTGIVVLLVVIPFSLFWWAAEHRNRKSLILLGLLSLLILSGIVLYGNYAIKRFNARNDTEVKPYEMQTSSGRPYSHIEDAEVYENGHRVWIYVCYPELEQEWNTRSTIPYGQSDEKGQDIRTTLIRYLASIGVRKDSAGVAQLSNEDIALIENGVPNCIYKHKFSIYPRLYELLWELNWYRSTGNPNELSVIQRLEYVKTGWRIFKAHPLLGIGTGDIDDAFKHQYRIDASLLLRHLQHRTHNQLLTFLSTFGLIGFTLIMLALILPPYFEKRYSYYLFSMFLLIGLLSMLNEDTLETHVGASFFAFFYTLFLYAAPPSSKSGHAPTNG